MKKMCLTIALTFASAAWGATAAHAQQAGRVTGPRPAETKPPVAQYDIGLISRKLAALEAQVAELKKRNAALESQVTAMKIKDSIPKLPDGTQDRLKRLEQALAGHMHHMPAIGSMALSALPGLQEIANKAGVGHVIEQWKGIKLHATFGSGGAPGRTGTPIPPGQ
jgi:hypothetical protein